MNEITVTNEEIVTSNKYTRKNIYLVSFLSLLILIVWFAQNSISDLFLDYGKFFFLGIGGAIVANSTGAGGGVVFIPAFSSLNISAENALATSILIQCFGMTVGAFKWIKGISHSKEENAETIIFLAKQLIFYAGIASIAGMLIGQYALSFPKISVDGIFSIFSIIFGTVLLIITVIKSFSSKIKTHLSKLDILAVIATSIAGGIVTSWISIGVGEWLALLLIFMGFPTMLAVAVAVTISSITVIASAPFQIINDFVIWEVVLFAAPAAMIGASVARYLAYRLGATRLKVFFSIWVIITGYIMLNT